MKDLSVAPRYAKALFLVTERRKETERALEDLRGLVPVLGPGTRVGGFLAQPGVRPADKRDLLRKGLDGKTLPIVAVFVDLLLRKKRLVLFSAVVDKFEALVEQAQGVKRANVVSAVPLTAAESERLVTELERFTNSRIKLTAEVDPSIIAGALVRIGDRVIDRSVRTLLEEIEDRLLAVNV